ncbi:MAG TPA: hypothetical protein VK597_05375 [Inquilinus sp.]|nr:hypothetical protein [Inquilinus sp.]
MRADPLPYVAPVILQILTNHNRNGLVPEVFGRLGLLQRKHRKDSENPGDGWWFGMAAGRVTTVINLDNLPAGG